MEKVKKKKSYKTASKHTNEVYVQVLIVGVKIRNTTNSLSTLNLKMPVFFNKHFYITLKFSK